VPADAPVDSLLTVQVYCFSHHVCLDPISIPLHAVLHTPMMLKGTSSGPCISHDGQLYVPSFITLLFIVWMAPCFKTLQHLA